MGYERLEIHKNRDGWVRLFSPGDAPGGLQFHSHRELEINLVVKGTGSYLIQGGKYPIQAGILLWLFPAQTHMLFEASSDFKMWVAVFRPGVVKRVTQGSAPVTGVLLQKDPGSVFVQEIQKDSFCCLDEMFCHLSKVEKEDHVYFNSGLAYMLRRAWEMGITAGSRPSEAKVHPAVERAIHMLRQGRLDGSLAMLAASAGISYSRLCGLFREQTGETLGHFRSRLRVSRFQELIAQYPERTLLDLSHEAGFGSYAQCHRMVLRETGKPPVRLKIPAKQPS